MKIIPKMAAKTIYTKTPSKVKKGLALAAPLILSAKEAAAHPSPFFHMHDSHGRTIGLAAGILLTAGCVIAAGIALYKSYSRKTNDVKENINKES